MNTWKYLFLLLLCVWAISLIGAFVTGRSTMRVDWNSPPEWLPCPTIYQFQTWIGAEADGWLCDGLDTVGHSETRDKWTEKMGNQMFEPYFVSGAPDRKE